jgi:hypothetical protein
MLKVLMCIIHALLDYFEMIIWLIRVFATNLKIYIYFQAHSMKTKQYIWVLVIIFFLLFNLSLILPRQVW